MPTTPEMIADFTQAATDLVQAYSNKEAEIDARVAALAGQVNSFVATAASASRRTFYVDQVLGDDLAPGTEAAPLKSIEEAWSRIPTGGQLTVQLLSDYVIDRLIQVAGGSLFISGYGVQRKVTFAHVDPNQPTAERSPGFMPVQGGSLQQIRFQNVLLSGAEQPAPPECVHSGFLQLNGLTVLRLHRCDLILPPGSDQDVVSGRDGGYLILNVTVTTAPADIGGRWVQGVAAGTDPLTLGMVSSNLTSL